MNDTQHTHEGHMNYSPFRIAGTTALSLLAIFLLAETVSVVQNLGNPSKPPVDTIVVSGKGNATAAPDTATISYTIKKTAAQVATAQIAATKVENTALAFLKQQNISSKDVRTTNYSTRPHYVYKTCTYGTSCPPAKVSGYDVFQSVSVKIRDLSKVGAVLCGLGNAGITNLSGPNFIVNDPTSAENQARSEAITNAKARAVTLAKELGVHLVRIVKYSETPNAIRPLTYNISSAASNVETNTPSVPTGENKYTVDVFITYEIR